MRVFSQTLSAVKNPFANPLLRIITSTYARDIADCVSLEIVKTKLLRNLDTNLTLVMNITIACVLYAMPKLFLINVTTDSPTVQKTVVTWQKSKAVKIALRDACRVIMWQLEMKCTNSIVVAVAQYQKLEIIYARPATEQSGTTQLGVCKEIATQRRFSHGEKAQEK